MAVTLTRNAAWMLATLAVALTIATDCPAQGKFVVTLLGTSSPQPRPDRFGPSTLVEAGEQKLLIDAGRGVPIRLWQLKVPMGKINALFLTHYHSDHTVGIPDLWLSGWLPGPPGRRQMAFQVIGPTGAKSLMEHLQKAYALDVKYRIEGQKLPPAGIAVNVTEFDKDGVVYERDGVKVIAFVVDHGNIKPAFGYRIEYNGHAAVISGDTRYNQNVIKYGTGADLLVHEVASARPELMVSPTIQKIMELHTMPREAGSVFAQTKPKLAAYTHFILQGADNIREPTLEEVVAETRQTYNGPLEVGEDLMSFDIGNEVTIRRYRP